MNLEMNRYPFKIIVRPLLVSGCFGWGPEGLFIYLADRQKDEREAAITCWHEIVHALYRAGGRMTPRTGRDREELERDVEALAQRLAMYCPEIIQILGLTGKFTYDKRRS